MQQGTNMAGKWQLEDIRVGATMEATFWANPVSESEFRLVRPSWGKTLTRRFTQRNLHASLMQIDRESPESSPLLTAPSGPHGNLASALFSDREKQQLELLANWVQQVVHQEEIDHGHVHRPGDHAH